MDDFRNIDFTNYLIVFDGNILGISVAPGELMADGDLKKYADCRTPEYAAWINLKPVSYTHPTLPTILRV